ncbi:MAG TPA: DUF1285 domain-containing protein [Alphaproteobacteria bacterium]|nr:DUF1285 domain-containing protein [Alphaproteobacteria bacterium]
MTKASTDVTRGANQFDVPAPSVAPSGAHPAKPPFQPFCGDIDIRIGRDGTWYYRGSPIGRPALVKLFASVLKRDEAGDYWLVTPAERGRIKVDDAPFTAVELTAEGEGRTRSLHFRTNLDETVTVGADHPIRLCHDPASGEPRPYVLARPGIGACPGLEALIVRSVYYQLVEIGVEEPVKGENLYGVWSRGHFFPLGRLDDRS